MITTPNPVLIATSALLKEGSTDKTATRLKYFDQAVRHTLSQFKWSFRRKLYTLTATSGVTEYALSPLIPDYDPIAGVYEVWSGSTLLYTISYSQKASADSSVYLTPDGLTLGGVADDVSVWYYAQHTTVTDENTVLNIPLPEAISIPISTYIKYLVHDGKRQRNDARNAILDYQVQVSRLKLSEASNKLKGLPKTVAVTNVRPTRSYKY